MELEYGGVRDEGETATYGDFLRRCFDVPVEKVAPWLALLGLDNVVLTPHIASNTEETMQDMGDCVLDNLRSWFAGKGAVTPVP